jgi:hypothetical protein
MPVKAVSGTECLPLINQYSLSTFHAVSQRQWNYSAIQRRHGVIGNITSHVEALRVIV